MFDRLLRRIRSSATKTEHPYIDFRCFSRSRLQSSPDKFRRGIEEYRALEQQSDVHNDYRNSFYFQFSCKFDNLADITAYFPGPVRSVEVMEAVKEHIDFNGKRVLSIGSHNGAELFWLYDHSTAMITGVEENTHLCNFGKFLIEEFNLSDRIETRNAEALQYICDPSWRESPPFDVILLHGLIYMVKDPLHLLKSLYDKLSSGGICSIETYVISDRKPVMHYLGDGTGWGTTFAYSESFIPHVLKMYGFDIVLPLQYGHRRIFIARKR